MKMRCALKTAHSGPCLPVKTRATTRLPGECANYIQFRSLAVGDVFDWIKDGPYSSLGSVYNSFWMRCTKTSSRKYRDETGQSHSVGTIDAAVYHVTRKDPSHD